jgi:hypothetical protein
VISDKLTNLPGTVSSERNLDPTALGPAVVFSTRARPSEKSLCRVRSLSRR